VFEKVWDGLAAGCLPIYLGAPNIAEHLPDSLAVIQSNGFTNVNDLADYIRRLMFDEAAYKKHLSWRHRPVADLGDGFQRLAALAERDSRCRLCEYISSTYGTE
jgi:hypothetical protein